MEPSEVSGTVTDTSLPASASSEHDAGFIAVVSALSLGPALLLQTLPMELVLDVANYFLAPKERFRLAATCKALYFPLMKTVIRDLLGAKNKWLGPEKHLKTSFFSDQLNAGKFSLITGLSVQVNRTTSFFRLSKCSMPSLTSFGITFSPRVDNNWTLEEEPKFDFPNLEEVDVSGYAFPVFFTAIVRDCPQLKRSTLRLDVPNNYAVAEQVLVGIPDAFLQTVVGVGAASGAMLLRLVTRDSFNPYIIHQEGFRRFDLPDGDQGQLLWTRLAGKESLRRLDLYQFRSKDLLHGLPPNLEEFSVKSFQLSRLRSQEDLDRLRDLLTSFQGNLSLNIRYSHSDLHLSENTTDLDLQAFANEIMFWSTLEVDGIKILGESDPVRKLFHAAVVRTMVDQVLGVFDDDGEEEEGEDDDDLEFEGDGEGWEDDEVEEEPLDL